MNILLPILVLTLSMEVFGGIKCNLSYNEPNLAPIEHPNAAEENLSSESTIAYAVYLKLKPGKKPFAEELTDDFTDWLDALLKSNQAGRHDKLLHVFRMSTGQGIYGVFSPCILLHIRANLEVMLVNNEDPVPQDAK